MGGVTVLPPYSSLTVGEHDCEKIIPETLSLSLASISPRTLTVVPDLVVLQTLEVVLTVVYLVTLPAGLARLAASAGHQAQRVVGEGGGGVALLPCQAAAQAGTELPSGVPGELDGVPEGEVVAVLLVAVAVGLPPAGQGRPGRGGGLQLVRAHTGQTHLAGPQGITRSYHTVTLSHHVHIKYIIIL